MNFGSPIRLNGLGIFVLLALFTLFLLYLTKTTVKDATLDKDTDVNLRKLLIAAVEAAEEGGKKVVNVKQGMNIIEHSKGKTKEGAEKLVTNADYASHCVMFNGLQSVFPNIGIISEETVSDCKNSLPFRLDPSVEKGLDALIDQYVPAEDLSVWIDPLDATQEFTEDLLTYVTTMVCVAYKGKPIIGVIHKPFGVEPRTTWAWVSKGQSPNLNTMYRQTKSTPTIIVSRSHAGDVSKIISKTIGSDAKVVAAGGSGYKVLELISGNATAYVHTTHISKWDICAGNAILEAVGGQMSTLHNQLIDYSQNSEPLNKLGLLATMSKHEWYASKFTSVTL